MSYPRRSLERRLWEKVDRRGDDECWPWLGSVGQGYGVISRGGAEKHLRYQAHRVAYELFVAPIPDGLTIDHLCENTLCCNPRHMEPVLAGVNVIRGSSPAAMNARKTHCKRGHEFTPENTYVQPNRPGTRGCLTCRRVRTAERWQAIRTPTLAELREAAILRHLAVIECDYAGSIARSIEAPQSSTLKVLYRMAGRGLVVSAGRSCKRIYWRESHGD